MEIVNFFETMAGKWFSQRTTHYLKSQTSRAGQSTLFITHRPATDPAVTGLCTQLGQDPTLALCGLEIAQESKLDGDTATTQGTALMVILTPEDGRGSLLQQTPSGDTAIGEYDVTNEVLTITTPVQGGQVEERLWYMNPNLRMRTSSVKQGDQVTTAAFCSEIRMGAGAPPKQ